ncbi:MAG: hypothetical protein ACRDIF_00060 [Actinomycetota bacterium]
MPYVKKAGGVMGLNYAVEPLAERLSKNRDVRRPGRRGSDLLSPVTVGGLEAITLSLEGGAGGAADLRGLPLRVP